MAQQEREREHEWLEKRKILKYERAWKKEIEKDKRSSENIKEGSK